MIWICIVGWVAFLVIFVMYRVKLKAINDQDFAVTSLITHITLDEEYREFATQSLYEFLQTTAPDKDAVIFHAVKPVYSKIGMKINGRTDDGINAFVSSTMLLTDLKRSEPPFVTDEQEDIAVPLDPSSPDFGKNNVIFTKEKADEARERLRNRYGANGK